MEEDKKTDKYGKGIKVSHEAYAQLEKIADSYGLSLKKTADHMINYFFVTGEDPLANRKDNMVKSIKQLQNTVVSFIREHETKHLEKIVSDFEMTRSSFSEKMEKLETLPSKLEIAESFKKLAELNSGTKEDISKVNVYVQTSLKNYRDFKTKKDTFRTELENIIVEGEKLKDKEGFFKQADFSHLVEKLKVSVNAIR
jgi:hypothetical protein